MAGVISLSNALLLILTAFFFIMIFFLEMLHSRVPRLRFSNAYVHFPNNPSEAFHSSIISKTNSNKIFPSNESVESSSTAPISESTQAELFTLPHVEHYKYRPNSDFKQHLTYESLSKFSFGAAKSKGAFLPYISANVILENGTERGSRPRFYRYTQSTHQCYQHYISLKYNTECGTDSLLSLEFVKPLLIVSVQRSGTHYMWEMLQRLQVDVHHEGVGVDGAISWLYAVNAHVDHTSAVFEYGKGYVINNPDPLHKNRFRHILHQVRHPLSVITTLYNKCHEFDSFWAWIHNLKGFKQIKQDQSALRRAMLLYLLWNKHIEEYADMRYQVETTSPRDVCLWAGFPASRCMLPYASNTASTPSSGRSTLLTNETDPDYHSHSAYSNHPHTYIPRALEYTGRRYLMRTHTNSIDNNNNSSVYAVLHDDSTEPNATTDLSPGGSGTVRALTWTDLDNEDLPLANELRVMCLEYGYSLDPQHIPQMPHTNPFTA